MIAGSITSYIFSCIFLAYALRHREICRTNPGRALLEMLAC